MTISTGPIPQAVAYPGTLSGFPSSMCGMAPEGNKVQALQINWNTNTYPKLCTLVNLQAQGVSFSPISKISTLYVDNLSNDHATTFIFPDTGYRFTAPPLTADYWPVITNNLQFYVINEGLTTGDTTNVTALNYYVAGADLNEQIPGVNYIIDSNGNIVPLLVADKYSVQTIGSAVPADKILIAAGVNWALAEFQINVSASGAASGIVQLLDGVNPLFNSSWALASAGTIQLAYISGLQLMSVATPSTALIAHIVVTTGTFTVDFNTYYSIRM